MKRKLPRISARKIVANRENARKSAGPKTSEGKNYSRRNALRHGLFAMNLPIAASKAENAQYQEILKGLRETYQPVGLAERLEVERIAVSWLRLKRIWAYENSEIARERIPLDERLLRLMDPRAAVADSPLSASHVTLNLLRKAETEITATGKISDELNAAMAGTKVVVFQQVWAEVKERAAQELAQSADEASASKMLAPGDPECGARHLLRQIQIAITAIGSRLSTVVDDAAQAPFDSVAVPRTEVLDRILRADAAAERQLNCAKFRLEQLQLRRKEQEVPPLVKGLAG